MDELKDKIVEAINDATSNWPEEGDYTNADEAADKILAIPEIANALAAARVARGIPFRA